MCCRCFKGIIKRTRRKNEGEKMEELDVHLEEEFITLGQLLKRESFISSGGLAKWYLSEHTVYLNDELENRRGKKLYPGDQLKLIEDNVVLNIKESHLDHEA